MNLRGILQNCGELKFSKNRESVKSADIETADIGDPLYQNSNSVANGLKM